MLESYSAGKPELKVYGLFITQYYIKQLETNLSTKMRFHCRSHHCDSDSNDCDVRLRHVATALSDGDDLHHSHHPHQHLCYLLPAVISAFIFT